MRFQMTRSGEATKMDEYVPKKIPIMRIKVKCLVDAPPMRASAVNTIMVVSEVLMERAMVWLTLAFAISSKFLLALFKRFSRIRSYTTMVSWMENPRMVSRENLLKSASKNFD